MKFSSPVYNIISVPIEKIEPNTYNPNSVAPPELKLLYDSIKEDGYTMPIVCYYDSEKDLYTNQVTANIAILCTNVIAMIFTITLGCVFR